MNTKLTKKLDLFVVRFMCVSLTLSTAGVLLAAHSVHVDFMNHQFGVGRPPHITGANCGGVFAMQYYRCG